MIEKTTKEATMRHPLEHLSMPTINYFADRLGLTSEAAADHYDPRCDRLMQMAKDRVGSYGRLTELVAEVVA